MPKNNEPLQPRNDREQRLVDETLRDAPEILKARRAATLRVVLISPHYTEQAKRAARAELAELAKA